MQAFATIMRPVIETVDRYGLTKTHLQKHKVAAMDFVQKAIGREVSSEAALKYQKGSRSMAIECLRFWTMTAFVGTITTRSMRSKHLLDTGGSLMGAPQENQ